VVQFGRDGRGQGFYLFFYCKYIKIIYYFIFKNLFAIQLRQNDI
jgi:hypothetical protein